MVQWEGFDLGTYRNSARENNDRDPAFGVIGDKWLADRKLGNGEMKGHAGRGLGEEAIS